MALDIAEQCGVTEVHDELVQIALDESENWHIRHSAAFIVSRLGGDEHKKKLMPLLNTTPEEDPEDELRGDALLALWPGHITARDAFDQITKERHGTAYGTYSLFLTSYLPKGLKGRRFAAGAGYIGRLNTRAPPGFSEWHGLRGKMMRMGWERWKNPAVLASFAKAAVSRIIRRVGLFNDDDQAAGLIAARRDQRAAVISAVIKYASDQKIKLPSFWGADIRIIGEEDLPWLLTELTQARYEFAQREFTALILYRI